MSTTDITAERQTFRDELLEAGLLVRAGVDGLYVRSGTFEQILQGVAAHVSRGAHDFGGPQYFFPPLIGRADFERTDYLRSFPDLLGEVRVFRGGDREHVAIMNAAEAGEDWGAQLAPAEVVLSSAACHALYPLVPTNLPAQGLRYEVEGFCFRHEPSIDPVRMQSFRMREFVFVGSAEDAKRHRDDGLARALELLGGLGLDVIAEEANDPFFGRAGKMLAANQRQSVLKYEVTSAVSSTTARTAIASANCHETHFGDLFDLTLPDGRRAESACVAFGLERITLALVRRHGTDVTDWPDGVRQALAV